MALPDLQAWLDDDERSGAPARLEVLKRFLLAYGAARAWLWLAFGIDDALGWIGPAAVVATVLAVCVWREGWSSLAARLALALVALEHVALWPNADNHFVLETILLVLVAVPGPDGRGAAESLQGLRWVAALVFFITGVQKLLYGLYVRGEFLAFMIGRGDRFGQVFSWLLPSADVARLESYDPMRSGQGPFRVEVPAFLVASNLVWILEIALAPLLLIARTRRIATAVTLLFVLGIQLGAREIGFALLFGTLLLVFLPASIARRILPVQIVFLIWVVLTAWGVLPGGGWLDRGWM